MGAARLVEPRGMRYLSRIAAGDLHYAWSRFPAMVHTSPRLRTRPETGVRGDHLRRCNTCAETSAKLPEWPVRHARHWRQREVVVKLVGSDPHIFPCHPDAPGRA